MQRNVVVNSIATSAILAVAASTAYVPVTATRHAHQAGRAEHLTACGVERWAAVARPGWDNHVPEAMGEILHGRRDARGVGGRQQAGAG